MKRFILIFILLNFVVVSLYSQNIETLAKAKPFRITGRIGAGSSYLNDERSNYDNRLGYNINLGLTFNIYNSFRIPFSFVYSDQQSRFNRPVFKRYGLSPTYKWVTVHGGYRSYSISPYLINGVSVLGGGIDLKPGKFLLSFFYGNMSNSYDIIYNSSELTGNKVEKYKRKVYGGKIGFGTYSNYFHLSFFKAKDDPLSGDFVILDSLSLHPKENVGFGVHTGVFLFKTVSIKINAASSIINENSNLDEIGIDEKYKKISSVFLPINESSRYALAYDAQLNIGLRAIHLGFKYQHIDPNYQSLGISYLQQDINNYTIQLNTSLFRSKLTFYGNFGLQKSNTKNYFQRGDTRIIGNAGLNLELIKNLSISLNYNNFNSESGLQVKEFLDSLRLVTNNQGINSAIRYSFGSKENRNKISFSYSRNTFNIVRNVDILNNNTSTGLSLKYSKTLKNSGWTFGVGLRKSGYIDQSLKSIKRLGGNINMRKKIGKQFTISLSPSYSMNITNGIADGSMVNISLRSRYKVNKRNSISLGASLKRRNTKLISPFTQSRISLRYSVHF